MIYESPIRISKTHVQYEINTQNAELRLTDAATKPSADVKTTPATLTVAENRPITFRADSYNSRRLQGFKKTGDIIAENANKGKQNHLKYMREKAQQGHSLAQIQDGVEIQDIVTRRLVNEGRMPSATLVSAEKVQIEWSEPVLRFKYNEGNLQYNWNPVSTGLTYIPGGVDFRVTQLPSVDIEYVGKPLYFPRSYSG